VFGVHYESDNSRLYVVCAKHVTQTQLLDEFKVFGTAVVKLNCDVNGFSKVGVICFLQPNLTAFLLSFLHSQSFHFLASFFSSIPSLLFPSISSVSSFLPLALLILLLFVLAKLVTVELLKD